MKVEKVSDVGPIIDTLVELKQLILIQSYVPNPAEDVRMFVVGDQVVGAMVRKAGPSEWRSSIHLGGRGRGKRQGQGRHRSGQDHGRRSSRSQAEARAHGLKGGRQSLGVGGRKWKGRW